MHLTVVFSSCTWLTAAWHHRWASAGECKKGTCRPPPKPPQHNCPAHSPSPSSLFIQCICPPQGQILLTPLAPSLSSANHHCRHWYGRNQFHVLPLPKLWRKKKRKFEERDVLQLGYNRFKANIKWSIRAKCDINIFKENIIWRLKDNPEIRNTTSKQSLKEKLRA